MIKVMLVDHEQPILRTLESFIKDYKIIEVCGIYTEPMEAIDELQKIKPDLVLLDTDFFPIDGIDIATKMIQLCPNTNIIFITAYDSYTVNALELYSLDYVLKPLIKESFDATLQKAMKRIGIPQFNFNNIVRITCFGDFKIGFDGQEPIKWRTEKTKDLFLFLLFNMNREVSKERIVNVLWPDTEIEKSMHYLHNGVYYIKKTLDEYGVNREQISISGGYILNINHVEYDVQIFDSCMHDPKTDPDFEKMEQLLNQCSDDYLEGVDCSWVKIERERLSKLFVEAAIILSKYYTEQKIYDKAETVLLKAYRKDPYNETTTKLLLNVYQLTGENAKIAMHYKSYAEALELDLGIRPNEEIFKIYNIIK